MKLSDELKRVTLENEELRREVQRLRDELSEGQIILENTIAHSEAIDEQLSDRTAEVEKQKRKSDDLLLNILPAETAEELKRWGVSPARSYESVTVMFTDFHGFTKISERLSPQRLVSELDLCFRAFDDITSRYQIEKIKTIGDAYLCVGGLPKTNQTHPRDVVSAALEMQKYMAVLAAEKKKHGDEFFEMRVGIHTGPLVAGIVGVRKFAYDIWGDTVNTAARLESSGEVGKVNISGATFELVRHHFQCTHRGQIAAKNKGEIAMYFVESEGGGRPSGGRRRK
ncbi:MAG TPA: adenylate/guanylate cyclase domain-containing protein [Chthoniobacteraceae bacterium]|jgi:class 3 adenylate cyclase|nr:adenylate/guanylate cyclase domain-containing protein [Chthoniobacteraceae bacterium]